jgi:hypothetical protein
MEPRRLTTEPDVKSVDLFKWIGERMIQRIEEQPITVDVRLTDGTITMEIPPGHPWFKELSRRKAEQVQHLRASFKPGDQRKLSQKPKPKKEGRRNPSKATTAPHYRNDTNSRATK